jgi:hypothetical protein
MSPSLLGIVFAAASVIGAINGRFVHHFKRFTLLQYSLFDVMMTCSCLLAIGLTRNLVVAVVAVIVTMGFWRVRSIMYQDHILRRFGDHRHKATLISTIGFFDSINFWVGPVVAFTVGLFGYYKGFSLIAVTAFTLLAVLFTLGVYRFGRPDIPAATPSNS